MDTKARELPTIYFGADAFYVDARLKQFRLKDFPYTPISFKDLFLFNDGSFFLYYDRNTKKAAENLKSGPVLPEGVTLFRLPPIEHLDPVGLARGAGLGDDTFIQKDQHFFPASDSMLKESVKAPFKRVYPHFSSFDRDLKEHKFKTKRR